VLPSVFVVSCMLILIVEYGNPLNVLLVDDTTAKTRLNVIHERVSALAVYFVLVSLLISYLYFRYYRHTVLEKYFKRFAAHEVITDYHFSKNFFLIEAPIMIVLLLALYQTVLRDWVIYYTLEEGRIGYRFQHLAYIMNDTIIIVLFYNLIIASITFAGKFALQRVTKEFDFYLAKAYFTVGSQKKDGELKYLVLSLDAYNRFLGKNLRLEIDVTRIYLQIIHESPERKTMIRESIGKALEKDELELVTKLAETLALPDKESILRREPALLNQQNKEIFTIIIPSVISIVSSIIGGLTAFRPGATG
jgi:hypothetical protein